MIKTDANGIQTLDFNTDQKAVMKSNIKNANLQFRDNFIKNNIMLREAYINKLNNIVCGIPTVQVPWDETTNESDIMKIIQNHPELELEYNLELYEEKMLSMGLDPTEGMFAQFPPGRPVLTSGNLKHLQYMQQRAQEEGLDNPELASFMKGVYENEFGPTEDAGAHMMTPQDQMNLNSMYQDNMMYQSTMDYQIGPIPTFDGRVLPMNGDYASYMQVPYRNLQPMAPPVDVSWIKNDTRFTDEQKEFYYNDYIRYSKDYEKYMAILRFEQDKQNIYNHVRSLIDERNMKANVNTAFMQPYVYQNWKREIELLDQRINEAKSLIPEVDEDDFSKYEAKVLEYNYQVSCYNNRKYEYINHQMRMTARLRGEIQVYSFEEMNKAGYYFDPNTKEWFDSFGRVVGGNNYSIEELNTINNIRATQRQLEVSREASKRRQNLIRKAHFTYYPIFMSVMKDNGYTEEEADKIWEEQDPYGIQRTLDYDPNYQTLQTWDEYIKRTNSYTNRFTAPSMIDIKTGKNVDDLTEEEFIDFKNRSKAREGNAIARSIKYITPGQALAIRYGTYGYNMNSNGEFMADPRRMPLLSTLADINSNMSAPPEGITHTFDRVNMAIEASNRSEAMRRPTSFNGYYDRNMFNDTIDNFGHKTRIGRTSDLLNEIENNQAFAKAMNEGVLGLSLPEEIGYNYNRRKVEFENSILQQFKEIGKRLPDGARIKDPERETYNDRPMKEIQKDVYSKKLRDSERLKQYFSPEIGGTWNADKVNNS